jgi:predicted alpha/beta superfamily hydrolase
MRWLARMAFVCFLAVSASSVFGTQKVRFIVHVPIDTPSADSVFVAGSLPSLGSWSAAGVKLARQADGTYVGDVELEVGQTLEFKLTDGSWDTVEKNVDGSERANRTVTIDAATTEIDVTVERWAGAGDVKQLSTVVGTLELHQIDSKVLKESRTIRVWLPADYTTNHDARYPVLYMQDGQNCFDRATSAYGMEWRIDETLTKLIADKTIASVIVVGIDNGMLKRINEFTFEPDSQYGGGHGAAYAEFVLTEVIPFIDRTYRTQTGQAHTYIGGSSLGGLISLEIARRHAGVFGGIIAMSPSIWWDGQKPIADVELAAGGLAGSRIWLDTGAREAVNQPVTAAQVEQNQRILDAGRRLDAVLTKDHIEHRFVIDQEHVEHNERSWAARFPQAITFVLTGKE